MSKATTSIVSMMSNLWSDTRSGAMRILLVAGAAALVSLPSDALAQTSTYCGPEVKEEVARALASVENAGEDQKAAL